ncbi:MAG: acyltransferase domain-containing protein [Deltaproteobacteria bacterium]|nr:MAG: acyltransferase domain-containing protein [Deltaproteobacteria bacterium]
MADAPGIAVIGLGCAFPGSPDVESYWRAIHKGVDCISEVSEARWDARFHDPQSAAVDRVYSRRAGLLPDAVRFSAGRFGIMPVAAEGAEPDQMLALQIAADTLADAGLEGEALTSQRVGVILGRGGYLTPGLVRLSQKVREAEQIASLLEELAPELDAGTVARIKTRFQERAGSFGPDTAIGLVPNLAASRIANRLDLRGPAYTVDAACASALIAVEHAVRELREGRCDVVLAGGVHLSPDVSFFAVFAQLGALSRAGRLAAFSDDADGLVIGEGIGMLALKRLDRAEADGDRVYAVIRGVGSASDGRAASVMTPRVDGQVLALRRAWAESGVDPRSLGLVEAHGTGTEAGDKAELATLREVFADGPEAVLGSVKSQIGHTMPAAGAAGLIKAVLAVHHGVQPPTLHCKQPRAELADSRFTVLGKARKWSADERVAAVNAFGFGGINAHVVLSAHGPAVPTPRPVKPLDDAQARVLLLAASSPEALLARLDEAPGAPLGVGPCRLALVDPTLERIERARKAIRRGEPWRGRGGMWFSPAGLLDEGGKVAWLFPGIEAVFDPETASVVRWLDPTAEPLAVEEGAAHVGPDAIDLESTGRRVVALAQLLDRSLRKLGLAPDMLGGHSMGEWSAMIAAGMLDAGEIDAFLDETAQGTLEVPGVLFAAAGCGVAKAEAAIDGLSGIAISHDNCPHQVILCGEDASIAVARERLIADGVICQVLPFRSGFHSPLFADYLAPHREHFARFTLTPAALPLYSATTVDTYPDDPAAIRDLVLRHLVEPLRYTALVQRLYADGARVFVQVGTGSLTGFVDDTLAGKPHLAVAASEPRREGLAQLRNLALALWAEGADVDLAQVLPKVGLEVSLSLGAPLIALGDELRGSLTAGPASEVLQGEHREETPVMSAFAEAMAALTRAGSEVHAAFVDKTRPQRFSERRRLSVATEPDLRDHSFFPQPLGWPIPSDGYPVVPMTMTIELLLEAGRKLAPDAVVVEARGLRAFKWLVVEPEVEVELVAERLEDGWVRARVVDYAEIELRLAETYPQAPEPAFGALPDPRPTPVDARQLYEERWMFHGPRYQGVTSLGPWDESGIEGVITAPRGPGSLLDNAGQILGYWLMAARDEDQLAMPVSMERIEWFGPHPAVGERVSCLVRVRAVDEGSLTGDVELVHDGKLWCRIRRWVDHRFQTDPHVWRVMRQPEHTLLSAEHAGFVLFDEQAHRAPSRDWLMRRYLGEAEKKAMLASGPRGQRAFLNGRIAAKDALRVALREDGVEGLFPVELPLGDVVEAPALGGPLSATGLSVAVAHLPGVSVARATHEPCALALRPASADPADAAREVARKRKGLPEDAPVAIEGGDAQCMVVAGVTVRTAREGDYLVAWSET